MTVANKRAFARGWRRRLLVGAGLALCTAAAQPAFSQSGSDFTNYYKWNAAHLLEWKIGPDPDGGLTAARRSAEHYFYDLDAQLIRTEVGLVSDGTGAGFTLLQTVHTRYDVVGNKTMVYTVPTSVAASDPSKTSGAELIKAASLVQTSYDAEGRAVCVATRMNPDTFATIHDSAAPPDACQLTAAGVFGPDRIVKTIYDKAGNVEQTIEAFGAVDAGGASLSRTYATYEYTANGKKKAVTDAIGNRTEFAYDKLDRLWRMFYPVTARGVGQVSTSDYEEYGYDANGNRTSFKKRDNSKLTTCYDALNREIARFKRDAAGCPASGLADDVFTRYDLTGAVIKVSYGASSAADDRSVVYERDNIGRATKETTYGKSVTHAYDKANNLTSMAWPGGLTVSYDYDAAERLTAVYENPGRSLFVPTYDASGRVSGLNRGNGANSTALYDAAGQMTSLEHALTDGRGVKFGTPEHNPAGQVMSRGISNADYAWIGTNLTLSASADGLNRDSGIASLTATCGVAGAGYDCNGNLTNDGFHRYGYDAENRLTSADGLQLSYDPTGRLAQVTSGAQVTRFLYSADQLVAEMDASGNLLRRYVHGPGTDDPLIWYEGSTIGDARWLHADGQGSIVAWSNLSGGREAVYTYGPYGEPGDRWGSGSRFRYTGQIALPEARLYHYKARAYEPVRGWFLQTDPIGDKDDLNLYAYVGGDPIGNKDPDGQQTLSTRGRAVPNRTPYGTTYSFSRPSYQTSYPIAIQRIEYMETQLYGRPLPTIRCSGSCVVNDATMNALNARQRHLGALIRSHGADGYPVSDGYLGGGGVNTQLRPGTRIDRYGSEYGTYVSPQGTPFPQRALPADAQSRQLNTYEVVRPLDVRGGIIAPAYGQVGGGVQYQTPRRIFELIPEYLRPIPIIPSK